MGEFKACFLWGLQTLWSTSNSQTTCYFLLFLGGAECQTCFFPLFKLGKNSLTSIYPFIIHPWYSSLIHWRCTSLQTLICPGAVSAPEELWGLYKWLWDCRRGEVSWKHQTRASVLHCQPLPPARMYLGKREHRWDSRSTSVPRLPQEQVGISKGQTTGLGAAVNQGKQNS